MAVAASPPAQLALALAPADVTPTARELAPGVTLLHGFATATAPALLDDLAGVLEAAPLRQLHTPGGLPMSVVTSNCGALGWISDRRGYRYVADDPTTARPWPALPASFDHLARRAAAAAGFPGFAPDACLINRYAPGARMTLHQDRDERDFDAPIVSVSLGLPATFQLGGLARRDRPERVPLVHGDVLVWGGPARLRFHGVLPIKPGVHPATGAARVNLTLRAAG